MVQPVTSPEHAKNTPETRTVPEGAAGAPKAATSEDLSRELESLRSDVARLTDTLGRYGQSKRREFEGEARRRADHARHEAQGRYDELEAYVQQNPAQALGIAAGIGFLIGLMRR